MSIKNIKAQIASKISSPKQLGQRSISPLELKIQGAKTAMKATKATPAIARGVSKQGATLIKNTTKPVVFKQMAKSSRIAQEQKEVQKPSPISQGFSRPRIGF